MRDNIVSAVFDNRSDAESAVTELRMVGVSDSAISIIAQQDGESSRTDGSGMEDDEGSNAGGILGGALAGAGVGTVLGIAALAIPGVGPFVAAGAIASAAIPGAALTGAAIGAAGGGLTGMLTDHGVDENDANYYGERITSGSTFVSVDTSEGSTNMQRVSEILARAGGETGARSRAM